MPPWFQRLRQMGRRPTREGGASAILEGPVTRTLLGLSVPMIMAMVLVTFYGLVDMFYLGRFSKEAMAAVGLAFPVTYLLHTFGGALGSACTSTCSRLIGAGHDDTVPNLLLHVIGLSAVLALVLIPAGIGLLGVEPTLNSTDTDPTVREMAHRYGLIYFLGGFFSLFSMSVNSLFRGEGDTMFPFKVMALGLLLNVVLDPIFIFGLGPAPRLGVAGAALTTVISFGAASLLVLRELVTNRGRKVKLVRGAWSYRPGLVRDLLQVAGPASLANIALPASVFMINAMVAAFIFGLTVDYGLFLNAAWAERTDEAQRRKRLARSGAAVTLSAITTMIGVGSLAVASHPALRSLGVTALAAMFSGWIGALFLTPLIGTKRADEI